MNTGSKVAVKVLAERIDPKGDGVPAKNLTSTRSLTPNELQLWLSYIEHQVGFILPISQQSWVQTTIERYLRQYDMTTTALLAKLPQDKGLYHQLFDDILIPRTQFFRHLATFNFIESYARRYQIEEQKNLSAVTEPFTVWSVGCSSGQEPVSVALSLANTWGMASRFRVYGSDFHQKSLRIAQQGQYNVSHLAEIPTRYQQYLLRNVMDTTQGRTSPTRPPKDSFALTAELAQRLTFFSYNLMAVPMGLPIAMQSCQLILCNNVLIYFRQFDQRDIINRLVDYLADEGVLILGAGELPSFSSPRLKRLPYPEINGFCKVEAPSWLEQLSLADGL